MSLNDKKRKQCRHELGPERKQRKQQTPVCTEFKPKKTIFKIL